MRACRVLPALALLAACSTGGDVELTEVTAKDGTTVPLCLSEDLSPRWPGYIELSEMDGFMPEDFRALENDLSDRLREPGTDRTLFGGPERSMKNNVGYDERNHRRRCDIDLPEGGGWYFYSGMMGRGDVPNNKYYIYYYDDRPLLIEAWAYPFPTAEQRGP